MDKLIKFIRANILIILLAIVPPLLIWYFFQRDIKGIEINIISNVPAVTIQKEYTKGIELKYQNQNITSLRVLDIKIGNSGNRPIERSDFDNPIYLKFNGKIISPVEIVSSEPPNLPVTIETKESALTISPILLNSKDSFVLRTRVADPVDNNTPITASARIKGVKVINITEEKTNKEALWKSFLGGFLASIFSTISIFSILKLSTRLRNIIFPFPSRIDHDVSQLQDKPNASRRASELAERLQISHHDYKSNLLLLRLKIEEQLRELARTANLSTRDQVGSISRLSRQLEEKGLVDHTVGALIRDIAPAMNRELHESVSYLSEKEFAELQNAALSIVVALESPISLVHS